MENENIIRQEAREFYKRKIQRSKNLEAIDDIQDLKSRLIDFYSPENKAIFFGRSRKPNYGKSTKTQR